MAKKTKREEKKEVNEKIESKIDKETKVEKNVEAEKKNKQEEKNKIEEASGSGKYLKISRKYSIEVGRVIKGMETFEARNYLSKVIEKKEYVPIRRFMGNAGHRKGSNWKLGKYPVKVAKEYIRVIKNAEENAKYIGLGGNLKIENVSITKGPSFRTPTKKKRGSIESVHVKVLVKEAESDIR